MDGKVEYLHGILIFKIPVTKKDAAIKYLQGRRELSPIIAIHEDALGIKIFFNAYDPVRALVTERYIPIENRWYAIYPSVTNLTVHGIRPFFRESSKFWQHILSWGPILNVYTIEGRIDEGGKKFDTDDFRVILNTPEVPELLNLPEFVKLPGLSFDFEVTRFCRLCRGEGHTQFECTISRCSPGNKGTCLEGEQSSAELFRENQKEKEDEKHEDKQDFAENHETFRGYGGFSPIKTPAVFYETHHKYQGMTVETNHSNSFCVDDTSAACVRNKVKSEPNSPKPSASGNSSCTDVGMKRNVPNVKNFFGLKNDDLRDIIRTVKQKENEQEWGNDSKSDNLKMVKQEQGLSPSHYSNEFLKQILATANQTRDEQLYCGESTKHHLNSEKMKKEPPCCAEYDDEGCTMEQQQSVEKTLFYKKSNDKSDIIKDDETVTKNKCSYSRTRNERRRSAPSTSSFANQTDSNATDFRNRKTNSLHGHGNVSATSNHHSGSANTSDMTKNRFKTSTSLTSVLQSNGCFNSYQSTYYLDSETGSAELQEKTLEVKRSTTSSRIESKFEEGSNAESSDVRLSSVKTDSSASPSAKNQNTSISHLSTAVSNINLKKSPSKRIAHKKSFNSNALQKLDTALQKNTSASAKQVVRKKVNNAIRFNVLMPPDCPVTEDTIRNFCRDASRNTAEVFKNDHYDLQMLRNAIQKILAFGGKKLNLRSHETQFLTWLHSIWIELDKHVRHANTATVSLKVVQLDTKATNEGDIASSLCPSTSRDAENLGIQNNSIKTNTRGEMQRTNVSSSRPSTSKDGENLDIQNNSIKKNTRGEMQRTNVSSLRPSTSKDGENLDFQNNSIKMSTRGEMQRTNVSSSRPSTSKDGENLGIQNNSIKTNTRGEMQRTNVSSSRPSTSKDGENLDIQNNSIKKNTRGEMQRTNVSSSCPSTSKDAENFSIQNDSSRNNFYVANLRSKMRSRKRSLKHKKTNYRRKKFVKRTASGKKHSRSNGTSRRNVARKRKRSRSKLAMVISPGLSRAIRDSEGVLSPGEMERFLVQVYRRVHCVRIARYFGRDVSGICRQLRSIEEAYYRSGGRSPKDELNMRIVQSLRRRMLQHAACEVCEQE